MIEIIECLQDTPEWHAARLGMPTSSRFATVMAKGRDGGASSTRKTYLYKLAAERVTGKPKVEYQNADMLRGQEQEQDARSLYCFTSGQDVQLVGFVKNGMAGCSPDGLIGEDGGVEFKCDLPHVQAERICRNDLPPEYRAQVQGCMWVTGRSWWDFVSYCPDLPLFVTRVKRDDEYIATIESAVRKFNDELSEIVAKIRRYGEPQPTLKEQLVESVKASGGIPHDILMAG